MTELRNVDAELGEFRNRITVAGWFVLFAFVLLTLSSCL